MLARRLMASLIIRRPHCPFWSHSLSLSPSSYRRSCQKQHSKLLEMPQATAYDKAATTRSYQRACQTVISERQSFMLTMEQTKAARRVFLLPLVGQKQFLESQRKDQQSDFCGVWSTETHIYGPQVADGVCVCVRMCCGNTNVTFLVLTFLTVGYKMHVQVNLHVGGYAEGHAKSPCKECVSM